MNRNGDTERRGRFDEVLTIATTLPMFCRDDIARQCPSISGVFVGNVIKQLAADGAVGIVAAPESTAADPQYAWIIDRRTFDRHSWVEQQITGGNQVTNAPLSERPRERLLEHGAHHLKNGELLAILIRSGVRGESAVQAGQGLAAHFEGGLERLPLNAPSELKTISRAVSKVAYCQIMAGIEIGRRIAEAAAAATPTIKINSTQAAIQYCQRHFSRLAQDAKQEEFHIVTLDTKLQPIQSHRITIGTLDASLVHPREVFKAAIRDSSSSILLVHNHPSGDATPSRQDHEVTRRLKQAGDILGITVVDHIIVARDAAVSLAEWE